MRRRILLWRLFASYVLVVVVALIAIGGYTTRSLQQFNTQDIASTLEAHVDLAAAALEPLILNDAYPDADRLCKRIGRETGTRITVIQPDGEVVGDSFESIDRMENHANRPEIQTAYTGVAGSHSRMSRTLGERLSYLAVPVESDGRVVAVVRASLQLTPLEQAMALLRLRLAIGLVAGVGLAFLASWLTAGWLGRPVTAMRMSADRIAAGDHQHRLPIPKTRELAQLADTINGVVTNLDVRITDANRHLGEGEAILASMVEGVLAVDTESRVISMNDAAGSLVGITAALAIGLPIEEAAPNREIQRFVAETLVSTEPIQEEFTLRVRADDIVQAQGTLLRDGDGDRIGAVVVLHDVTRLRKLEKVRRDFVANVSHELKSPITAIKSDVGAILDGGFDDPDDVENRIRTVATHANRLNAIIEDLLALSRFEEDDGVDQRFEVGAVRTVLDLAIRQCAVRVEERDIDFALACEPALTVRMNPALLEQAVANLIENAVQYSEDGGRVEIAAARANDHVSISVTDHGCGIAAEHLPRLFERFYRVDSPESRNTAGTGLGLAIVQHIARAHDGGVRVTSTPREGSTFTIELPA